MEKVFLKLKMQEQADLKRTLASGFDTTDLVYEEKPISVVFCIDDREEATDLEPAYGGHMEIYGVYAFESPINMISFFSEDKISALEQTIHKRSIGFLC